MKHERGASLTGPLGKLERPERKRRALTKGKRSNNSPTHQAKKASFDQVLRSVYDLNRAIRRITESRARNPCEGLGDVATVWKFEDHPQPSESKVDTLYTKLACLASELTPRCLR